MQAVAADGPGGRLFPRWRPRLHRPGRPSWRRSAALAIAASLLLMISSTLSTVAHLQLPTPTGAFETGKVVTVWMDPARPEPATVSGTDRRHVRVVTWYPAERGTGDAANYIEGLEAVADGLVASGEVGSLEASGLRFVRDPARAGASVAPDEPTYPIVLLSPGNATNVEFYSALAEDLASHGFVVIGLDHPYQSAAVAIDGDVAVYTGDPPLGQAGAVTSARIDQRVADIAFVLDILGAGAPGLEVLADRLDLTRIGIMGHSNGGVAAAEACRDPRIDACLNIDGQLAGGPFSARPDPAAPAKPFLYLTKETELHPALAALFEEAADDTFRVVVPEAAHDEFADVAMFRPRLLPTANKADDVITVSRGLSRAFFDHVLRDAPVSTFSGLEAPTDIQIYVYPLVARQ